MTKVVEYGYDAWGKALSRTGTLANTLGKIQPFRYRGYVYDEETGDYYLRSRYYRPGWGRFISADALMKGNLYCYCGNTPSVCIDPDGMDFNYADALDYAALHCKNRNPSYGPKAFFSFLHRYNYCTNFVSQCLKAGGLEMDRNWYNYGDKGKLKPNLEAS